MAQRTSQEVVDVGSRLPSGTARLDLSPAMLRDGSTPTSDREVPLSQGRTVLYATLITASTRLIHATRSRPVRDHPDHPVDATPETRPGTERTGPQDSGGGRLCSEWRKNSAGAGPGNPPYERQGQRGGL